MNINQRIKFLRKEILKLNQRDFAADLGMTQTGVSSIEKNGATVTDRVIKSICLIYKISEVWLRDGIEPVKLQPQEVTLEQFVREHGGTELDTEIVKAYFSIPPEVRQIVIDCVKNVFSNPFTSEPTVEDLEAEYKKMLSGLASSRESSASNITDENISTQTSEG